MNQFTASLWGDEGFAAVLAQKSLVDIVIKVSHDTSPPLFYFTLHLWMKIFGTSEAAIRSLSFLYFLLLVLTIFLIGKLLWDKKTGLLAALLTFANPFLFRYGFEGRMYSILAFFSTLSVYFYLKKNRWGFILATAAALYSHHFAIFVVFVEFLWSLKRIIFEKQKIVKEIAPFFLIGLLYLPWLYPLYSQTLLVKGGFWLARPQVKDLYNLLLTFLFGQVGHRYEKILLFMVFIILLLRRYAFKKKFLSEDGFLLLWFFMPIFLTFIISQVASSIFFDRYLLLCIPPIILLLVSRRRLIGTIFIVIFAFYFLNKNLDYFTHPTKRPFRELAVFVKNQITTQDKLINFNEKAHHLWESKYYGLAAPLYVPEGELPFYVGTALMEKNDTISTLPITQRLGVITSSDEPEKISLSGFTIKEIHKFKELKFIWFLKD